MILCFYPLARYSLQAISKNMVFPCDLFWGWTNHLDTGGIEALVTLNAKSSLALPTVLSHDS